MTECVVCFEDKPNDDFRRSLKKCKTCESKRDNRQMKTDPVRYLFHLAYGRRKRIEFNLSLDYLRGVWDSQSGTCALSGLTFSDFTRAKDPYNPSLDRIDPEKGYVAGNVRFVLWGINNALNSWGLPTYLRIARQVLDNQTR